MSVLIMYFTSQLNTAGVRVLSGSDGSDNDRLRCLSLPCVLPLAWLSPAASSAFPALQDLESSVGPFTWAWGP